MDVNLRFGGWIATIFICLLASSTIALAQNGAATVSGVVIDGETSQPLEFATVTILNKKDSSLIAGEVTDGSGRFAIAASPGSYLLQVQFVSYKTVYNPVNVSAGQDVNVGNLRIYENVAELSEVVITGERTTMEMKLDKRIFNIGEDLVNRGGDASTILDNLPSVTVDVDGNVSLRGSQSVKILINGKPSGLVGMNGTEGLQQLDASLVERVEIITNPSARYEAEGMAGIINIILKKQERHGVNGAFTLKGGYPADHGASVNLNYRRNWFNIFGNYSLSYRNSPRQGASYQEFYSGDELLYTTNVDRDIEREDLTNSFRFGTDIYLNDKNIITGSMMYRISDEQNLSEILYYDRFPNNELASRTERFNDETEDEEVFEYSLNYTRTFSSRDHKFSLDIQFEDNQEVEDASLSEVEFLTESPGDPLFQRYLNREKESDMLLQADYVHPFSENGRFEVGFRSSLRKIDNSYIVEEMQDNEWVVLQRTINDSLFQFNNDFIYDEDIHAFYGIYANEFDRFSVQAGLRAEYTQVATELQQTDQRNEREYFNLFPSVHVTYSLANSNSFQASYSRRFDRPGFWHLNPFYSYEDSRNFRSGNPNLEPEFTDSYELGYLKNWTKGSFYYGAYFRHTTNEVDRISYVEDSVTFSTPQNLAVENAYGFEANLSRELFDWFNLDGNLNFYRAVSRGSALGMELESKSLTMSGRLNAQVELFNDYNLQVSGFYRAPQNTTQGSRQSMYAMDIGVSKELFGGKGTIVLNARNVLNSLRWRGETIGDNFYSRSEFQWRPRQFGVSFTYRLNNNNNNRQRPENRGGNGGGNGIDDEGGDF